MNIQKKPRELYLHLLKKTLSFLLWPEPPIPITTFDQSRSAPKKIIINQISSLLKKREMALMKTRNFSREQRENGMIWPGYADTMIGMKRLNNIQKCLENVIKEDIEGDLIETGVWRGGACIFMRAVLAAYNINNRKVYVADSFEGLPKPDAEKYPADRNDTHNIHSFLAVSQEEVENNFKRYALLDEQVVFLKGWFKDSLPNAPIEKLSLLRLDGDMYGSTIEALEALYPKLSRGGYCIIDDYALKGCKGAVEDFRKEHNITDELKKIDWSGRYWRKT